MYAPFVVVTATTETIRGRPRVRLNEAYINALVDVGLVPIILPPIAPPIAVAALRDIAGLVLTGGEDVDPHHFGEEPHSKTGEAHRARDAYEIALAREAYQQRIPTLAICRGAQVMNVALGGSLVQDIASERQGALDHDASDRRNDRVHEVDIDRRSRLAAVVGTTQIFTNSSHHQSIDRIGDGLHVVAKSPDGIIEAAEATDRAWWMVAVQWHPEELTATVEDWDRRLFSAFADEVRATGRD